jgi:endoglucanase
VAPPPPPAPVASPSAPATPASNTPAGAKPPILKQFVQQGDPSAATYGASGSAWIYANDAQEITRIIKEAKAANQTPVFTQYNIPDRDNGGGSAGGASNLETYAAGVEANAKAIGDAAAVVVIEPDALAEGKDPAIVKRAVEIYKQNCPNARIYIDAGHALWPSDVNEIADKLVAAGVKDADGFSLNVSNFQWTTDSLKRGDDLVAALAKRDPALASKQFVVDTSRNGNGAGVDEAGKDTWGDPVKAKNGGPIMNGPLPSTETNDPHCAAFLWIKPPGFGDNRTRSATQFGGSGWVTPNQKPPLGP